MKFTEYLFKVITSNTKSTRSFRIILLYVFHFSVILTTYNGVNVSFFLGIYKMELGCGFYLNEQY